MNLHFLSRIEQDFPQFSFMQGDDFAWSAAKNTIFFNDNPEFELLLLHELSHAILGHRDFKFDIELIQIETEAWNKTAELTSKYKIPIDKNSVQEKLDTYRDWLHKRSLCPNCLVNGFQKSNLNYSCPACNTEWRVNDSRFKHLRKTTK